MIAKVPSSREIGSFLFVQDGGARRVKKEYPTSRGAIKAFLCCSNGAEAVGKSRRDEVKLGRRIDNWSVVTTVFPEKDRSHATLVFIHSLNKRPGGIRDPKRGAQLKCNLEPCESSFGLRGPEKLRRHL